MLLKGKGTPDEEKSDEKNKEKTPGKRRNGIERRRRRGRQGSERSTDDLGLRAKTPTRERQRWPSPELSVLWMIGLMQDKGISGKRREGRGDGSQGGGKQRLRRDALSIFFSASALSLLSCAYQLSK